MGLDVYVGTLTRYFGGAWETVVQQQAAADGVPFAVIRLGEGGSLTASNELPGSGIEVETVDPGEAGEIRQAVESWRTRLNAEFASVLPAPLDWDESPDAPYFTDKPAWDPYGALLLLAAHDWLAQPPGPEPRRNWWSRWLGQPPAADLEPPERAVANWHDHPVWQRASANGFANSPYPHLLTAELWLPCAFTALLPTETPGGQDLLAGSSVALLEELRTLNDRTLKGQGDDLQRWREAGAEFEAPFPVACQFVLALMLGLAERSLKHRLPMKLDY